MFRPLRRLGSAISANVCLSCGSTFRSSDLVVAESSSSTPREHPRRSQPFPSTNDPFHFFATGDPELIACFGVKEIGLKPAPFND
jgi:hypothetical protein